VPDIYQGCELWDLSLVDPDNRRPVDFAFRRRAIEELRARVEAAGDGLYVLARSLLDSASDGCVKLYVILRALELRRAEPELFAHGRYEPLEATGSRSEHVIAYARALGSRRIVVVAPRLALRLSGGRQEPPLGAVWEDTSLALPPAANGHYRNLLTGERVVAVKRAADSALPLADVFQRFPLALLEQLPS
jgi:(1->4)-alpha-D-glucan 1-alpha-D-glucosylmutase